MDRRAFIGSFALGTLAMPRFGATSTTDDVLAGRDLSGKRVLVTGVSAGLGVETARVLAAHGVRVVGAARDLAKAERATAQVRVDAATDARLGHPWLRINRVLRVMLHTDSSALRRAADLAAW